MTGVVGARRSRSGPVIFAATDDGAIAVDAQVTLMADDQPELAVVVVAPEQLVFFDGEPPAVRAAVAATAIGRAPDRGALIVASKPSFADFGDSTDPYVRAKRRAPTLGATLATAQGEGRVVAIRPKAGAFDVALGDGSIITVAIDGEASPSPV